MKRILITGANGFIGKNLFEYFITDIFKKKFEIFAPSHSQLDLLDSGLVAEFIRTNKVDIIIHCANVGGGRDTFGLPDVVRKNTMMFFNIVRNSQYCDRIISLGSGAEYDKRYYHPMIKEDFFDTHVPIDDYGFSKYVCSKYIEHGPSNIICLRLFAVYGKYEKYLIKFISNAILRNLFNLPIIIYQNVYFDYLFIDDLVKIIEQFVLFNFKEKFYNVCTSKPTDLVSIANLINNIGQNKSEIIIKNPGLNTKYSGDNTRLLKEIPKLRFTTLETGICDLYRYYEGIRDEIDPKQIQADLYGKFYEVKDN